MSTPSKPNRRKSKAVRRPETVAPNGDGALAEEPEMAAMTSEGDPQGWLAIMVVGATLLFAGMLTLMLVAASGNA